jgi:hypothetical protein
VTQPDREQAISRAFVALADTLVDDYDIIDMLDQLVSHSVALLAADAAAIMLGDAHRHLRVVAASSDDAKLMELLQLQNEQGPCLDCYHTATPGQGARRRHRRPMADVRSRSRAGRQLSVRARAAATAARQIDRRAQPVSPQPRTTARVRPDPWTSPGRRGHHRNPAATGHPQKQSSPNNSRPP